MKVLLSIKPEFAHKIFDGEKKYEFRRSIFKRPVKKVIVYASAPISKVIGEFEIDTILYDDLSALWDKTSEFAGIEEGYFLEYFVGKECGYAIRIKKTKAYDKHLCIKEHFQLDPPQSFAYVSDVKKKALK